MLLNIACQDKVLTHLHLKTFCRRIWWRRICSNCCEAETESVYEEGNTLPRTTVTEWGTTANGVYFEQLLLV